MMLRIETAGGRLEMRSNRITASLVRLALAALLAAAACSKTTPEAGPASSASASSSGSSAVAAPSAAPSASAAASGDGGASAAQGTPSSYLSVPDRFAREATSRPTGVPRIEDCLAAWKAVGAEIREERQHLGAPFQALYCDGFQTGNDVHVSVCEYKDAAAATAGREVSEKGFASVPDRKVYRNGGTTFTVRIGTKSPANDALVKKMVTAFEGVKPATGPAVPGKAPNPFATASSAGSMGDPPAP
jgi:hypothetical protein